MASLDGIAEDLDFADAFCYPKAPASVSRIGRLLFHTPFADNSSGSLFELKDFFGTEYAKNPYSGQMKKNGNPNVEKQMYERMHPLLFRYLNLLYDFRCAYFHGELPITEHNNQLAKYAYQSLRELYPAIMR